jgi:hypothetical protein
MIQYASGVLSRSRQWRNTQALATFFGVVLLVFGVAPNLVLAATAPAASGQAAAGNAPVPPLPNTASTPAASSNAMLSEEDQIVLQVRLRNRQLVLSDAFVAYRKNEQLLLPLGSLMTLLDFPVVVDANRQQANGWFLREDQTFALDLTTQTVTVVGGVSSLPAGKAVLADGDIWVDSALVQQWFAIQLKPDYSNLVLELSSQNPLPVEAQLEREDRRKQIRPAGAFSDQKKPLYPVQDSPYSWADWPMFNVSTGGGYRKDSTGKEGKVADYSVQFAGDLGKMTTEGLIVGKEGDQLQTIRLTAGRKDPNNELLGPLKSSSIQFGDVFGQALPLVGETQNGRGAVVSSFPLDRPDRFDETDLRGNAQPGYDVELYRNEELIGVLTVGNDGLYEFNKVNLNYGENLFRLVFYGPQGQKSEETKRVLVGFNQSEPGKWFYRSSVVEKGKNIFNFTNDSADQTDGSIGSVRSVNEAEYGVNRYFAVGANVATLEDRLGERSVYSGASLSASPGFAFGRADLTSDNKGGSAAAALVQTNLGGINWLVGSDRYLNGFRSETTDKSSGAPLTSANRVRGDTTLDFGKLADFGLLPSLNISGTAEQEYSQDGTQVVQYENRLATFVYGTSLSNTVTWQLNRSTDNSRDYRVDGNGLISNRFADINLRGGVAYEIRPIQRFTSANLTTSYRFDQEVEGVASVLRNFTDQRTTTGGLGLNLQLENMLLGLSSEYSTDRSYAFLMNLSFSTVRNPWTGEWVMAGTPLADNGSIAARTYLDENSDQRYNGGDRLLSEVSLASSGASLKQVSDQNGVVLMNNLTPYRYADISLDESSLEDPYQSSVKTGISFLPRPGKVLRAEFPVTTTGEVDGVVYLEAAAAENGKTALASVLLELVRAEDGQVVASTKTSFDGFYLFEKVAVGQYLLRISPQQLSRLKIASVPPMAIALTKPGQVLSNRNFVLKN